MHVWNINNIGYWYMNYVYMQVLNSSENYQQFNCITPKRAEFLDFCCSVGETNIS